MKQAEMGIPKYKNSRRKVYTYNKDVRGNVMTILKDNSSGANFVTGYKYTDFGETTFGSCSGRNILL